MNVIPVITFCVLLIGDGFAEYAAMLYTGTLKRKHTKEWTCYVVVMPFKAMLCATIIEHIVFKTHPALALTITGGIMAATGIIIRVYGHIELNGAFSQYVEKTENQQIVQSGMYATIRHPMYIGSILLFIGMPLVLAATWAWIFSVAGIVGIFIRIRKEEKFLAQELPGYREYMQKTWRLVPHIF